MRINAQIALLALALLISLTTHGRAQDRLIDVSRKANWATSLSDGRGWEMRVVICFDEASVLREIAKWDATTRWPVLLWHSNLVPKFIRAYRPGQVLLARYAKKDEVTLSGGLAAVSAAWGADEPTDDPKAMLEILRARKRKPNGAILVSKDSPEFLGGIALAAGRMQLPVVFDTPENHAKRVTFERKEEIRRQLAERLRALGISFEKQADDLDFVTVANDMPFGYTLSDPDAHPGGYTIDDAVARNDDHTRWGWVGRLTGGPARSVYMAMGAIFLQPRTGLFFSRYNPASKAFGRYDPEAAVPTFSKFFPTEAIRHPDATLTRWREVQWPEGNRAGFMFVNSSGGATSWSTSGRGATHFDVPDTVPTVVHYTHSGSAARPFDTDTIAGRWMANGAYVYFGSYSEPYLGAFIPATALAARVTAHVPLGAGMRHLYEPRAGTRRTMKVKGVEKTVPFNMTGPWKLAYFGDPSYQVSGHMGLGGPVPTLPGKYYSSVRKFMADRRRDPAAKTRHLLAGLGLRRLDPKVKKLIDTRALSRVLKALPADATAAGLTEMTRLWATHLRKTRGSGLTLKIPSAMAKLVADGADTGEASRHFSEFAKTCVAAGDVPAPVVRQVLVTACALTPSKSVRKPFFAWVKEAAKALGIDLKDLKKEIGKTKWLTAEGRKVVEAGLK